MTAFGKTERSLVKTTKLKNGDGGKTTKDKVFILSVDDLNNNKYHFDGAYSNICMPTEYAVKHGLKSFDPGEDYVYEDKDRCSWWLRNLGGASMFANYMNSGGTVLNYGYVNYNATFMHDGYFQDYNIVAVRPAVCISLK